MSTIKLAKYAEEGRLDSVMDAEFLRRKLGAEDALDFAGVELVTPAFLDALLGTEDRGRWTDRLRGATGAVAEVLAAWLGRTPGGKPSPEPAAGGKPLPPLMKAEEAAGKYTPTRLVRVLKSQLTKYIEGAYPLSHTTLLKARRALLRSAEGGRLLAQDPFVGIRSVLPVADRLFEGLY